MADIAPTVCELVISRIQGYSYPSNAHEDKLFAEYFGQSRSVSVGGRILLQEHGWELDPPAPLSHIADEVVFYPYAVRSMKAASAEPVLAGMTSRAKTRVQLEGMTSSSIGHDEYLVESTRQRCQESPSAIVVLPLPSACCQQPAAIACQLGSLEDDLRKYDLALSSAPLRALSDDLLHALGPRFSADLHKLGIAQQLCQDGILVDCSSSGYSQTDILPALEHACRQLGQVLLTMDCRLLGMNPSKLQALPLAASSTDLSYLDAQQLLAERFPCVLYLNHMDAMLVDSGQPGDTPDEVLAAVLGKLLQQLSANQPAGDKDDRMHIVAVVASCSETNAMKPALRHLFPVTIRSRTTATVSHPAVNSDDERLFTAEGLIELGKQVVKYRLGSTAAHALRSDCLLQAMKRVQGSHWMRSYCMQELLDDTDDAADSDAMVGPADVLAAVARIAPIQELKGDASSKGDHASIAPVRWSDIGGLDRVRKEILDVLELPIAHPELFPAGAPRRQGVLLYGPPGTGKTLVAKAVATECGMTFLSVKGPELLDAYVGESEKNVRDLFQRARDSAPCVLFFDEVDSLAPARAKGHDSGGGVMDRIVAQLLTEIDTLAIACNSTEKFVFLIAATNRPDLLDPALLRPGRLDRKIYLGVTKDPAARLAILTAQTRSFILHPDVRLEEVSKHLPKQATGADIGAATSAAYSLALERKLTEVRALALQCRSSGEDEELLIKAYLEQLPEDELKVQVMQADLLMACSSIRPTAVDTAYYEQFEKELTIP